MLIKIQCARPGKVKQEDVRLHYVKIQHVFMQVLEIMITANGGVPLEPTVADSRVGLVC